MDSKECSGTAEKQGNRSCFSSVVMLGCPSWHVAALQLCVPLFTFAAGFRRRLFPEFWSVYAEKKQTILMASGSCLLWMQSWRCPLPLSLPRLQTLTFAQWFVQSSQFQSCFARVWWCFRSSVLRCLSQYFGTVHTENWATASTEEVAIAPKRASTLRCAAGCLSLASSALLFRKILHAPPGCRLFPWS